MLVAALACVVIIAGVPGGECKPKLKIKGGGTEMAFVSHILCKDEAHCKDLHSHLLVYDTYKKLVTAFGLMAKAESKCPSKREGGSLGYFPRGEMSKDFEAVIFNPETPLETLIAPFKSTSGWHIAVIHDRFLPTEEHIKEQEEKKKQRDESTGKNGAKQAASEEREKDRQERRKERERKKQERQTKNDSRRNKKDKNKKSGAGSGGAADKAYDAYKRHMSHQEL